MVLRMLLVLVAVLGLTLGGCEKKEPTIGEQIDQAKQEAEAAAEEAQPAAEDAAEDAEDVAKDAEKALEDM